MFDLRLKHNFSVDVNKNIKVIVSKLTDHFVIKDDVEVPVIMSHVKQDNGMSYYIMYYDGECVADQEHTIKIWFINSNDGKYDNSAYLNHLSRTDTISGTQLLNVILKFLKTINVKKVRLYDGASIKCHDKSLGLANVKLLESGLTWYMKFGFEFDVEKPFTILYQYKTHKECLKRVHVLLDKFKKITVNEVIEKYESIIKMLTDKKDIEVVCINKHLMLKQDYYKNKKYDLQKAKDDYIAALGYIKPYAGKYLYECMLDLFKKNCEGYLCIENELLGETPVYSFTSGSQTITREYCMSFLEVNEIRNNYGYVMKL